ncbi:hypothetical protein [Leptolyngbya sp. O-77]|uniref:hypothetical protein n=1 Tax=Leptolyngbya sp. O-77 TaxID=1080068 RepID=UPI000AF660A4|nr:hypothetical protein [Leptolyngbya sp. O-77]
MDDLHHSISSCRRCAHYHIEGRRGGHCQLLGVPVQGAWDACPMAQPQFLPVAIAAAVAEVEQVIHCPPLVLPEPQPIALLVEMFVDEAPRPELEPVAAAAGEAPSLLPRSF